MKRTIFSVIAVGVFAAFATTSFAQDDATEAQNQSQLSEKVFGWQLMSEEERAAFRNEMRSLQTQAERQAFRQAHDEKMAALAAAQGATLAAPESHQGTGQGRGRRSTSMQQPSFADFDVDGDGFIDVEEYTKVRAERIAQRAKEGRAMKNIGQTTFAGIDTDEDGRASREEFAAHQAAQRANRHR